ncbi:MAG: RNA-binding protein [Bacteroidetes bacterium]|nr:MAG: RNA-binding protein [Bacteroidota bacterium]
MNIFVAQLNYNTTDSDLEELFGRFGKVTSAKVILDRETGRSRGFAFVEMDNDDEAQDAIDNLSGTELNGRTIEVNKAKPREEGGRRPSGGGGGGGFNRGGGGGGGYNSRGGGSGGGGGYNRGGGDRDRGRY